MINFNGQNRTVKKLLLEAANFIDSKYEAQRQRIIFTEFIEINELELALDSLLELSDEVEECFEYGFWMNLKQAAVMMKLIDQLERIDQKNSDFGNEKPKCLKK